MNNKRIYIPLSRKFYLRNTLEVSKGLLGKLLIRKSGNKILAGKIVETEAYIGEHDPACHAYKKFTNRSKTLYETGGTIYVYFVYGKYHCFNIVTEEKGKGCAVLIRAIEPLMGLKSMKINRGKIKTIFDLTNGPSKLCLCLGIDLSYNGGDIAGKELFITESMEKNNFQIYVSKRIGLNSGKDFPYRFFIKNNPYVSKHIFNKEAKLIN